MARYLSLDWIDDVSSTASRSEPLRQAAAGRSFAVTQVVRDGPEGDVTYHLSIDDGAIEIGPGAGEREDVRFVQDWETAVAVATGTLNAQEAFLKGKILLTGDRQALLDHQTVFAALDGVFREVQERTEYA